MSMLNSAVQIRDFFFLAQCKEHVFTLITTVHLSSMLEKNNKNNFFPMTRTQAFYFGPAWNTKQNQFKSTKIVRQKERGWIWSKGSSHCSSKKTDRFKDQGFRLYTCSGYYCTASIYSFVWGKDRMKYKAYGFLLTKPGSDYLSGTCFSFNDNGKSNKTNDPEKWAWVWTQEVQALEHLLPSCVRPLSKPTQPALSRSSFCISKMEKRNNE